MILPCTRAMLARWSELMAQEPYVSMPTYTKASRAVEHRVRWEFGCYSLWFWEC
jgi:hypothetical protein